MKKEVLVLFIITSLFCLTFMFSHLSIVFNIILFFAILLNFFAVVLLTHIILKKNKLLSIIFFILFFFGLGYLGFILKIHSYSSLDGIFFPWYLSGLAAIIRPVTLIISIFSLVLLCRVAKKESLQGSQINDNPSLFQPSLALKKIILIFLVLIPLLIVLFLIFSPIFNSLTIESGGYLNEVNASEIINRNTRIGFGGGGSDFFFPLYLKEYKNNLPFALYKEFNLVDRVCVFSNGRLITPVGLIFQPEYKFNDAKDWGDLSATTKFFTTDINNVDQFQLLSKNIRMLKIGADSNFKMQMAILIPGDYVGDRLENVSIKLFNGGNEVADCYGSDFFQVINFGGEVVSGSQKVYVSVKV